MSRPSSGSARSWKRAAPGSPATAPTAAPGLRTFSVSGRVKEPGVKLCPAGITLKELVDQYCGGMADGHTLKGYLPGGPSGGILPASMADIPLDFGTLEQHGSLHRLGGGRRTVRQGQYE